MTKHEFRTGFSAYRLQHGDFSLVRWRNKPGVIQNHAAYAYKGTSLGQVIKDIADGKDKSVKVADIEAFVPYGLVPKA